EGLRCGGHSDGQRPDAIPTRRGYAGRASAAGERSRPGDTGSIWLPAGVALRPVWMRLAARVLGRPGLPVWFLRRISALLALRLSAVGPALGLPALVI